MQRLRKEQGAAALEYILVSTFAALVTLAALAFIGKVMKQQLETMAEKLGVEADVGDLGSLVDD